MKIPFISGMRLKYQLMILIAGVALIISALYYSYARSSQFEIYSEGLYRSQDVSLKYIRSGLEYAFNYNDYNMAREIYNWILQDERILFATLYDTENRLIRKIPMNHSYSVDLNNIGQLSNGAANDTQYIVRKNEIRLKNKSYNLYTGFSSAGLQKMEARIFNEVGKRTAAIFLIGLLLAFLISRGISGPLKKLGDTADKISKGDQSLKADETDGSAEVKSLAVSFNKMLAQILESQKKLVEEITKYNDSIKSRNAGLKSANIKLEKEILDRAKAEEALRESESLLRSVIDTVPASIAYIDSSLAFLQANSALAETFGASKEKIIGSKIHETAPEGILHLLEPKLTGNENPENFRIFEFSLKLNGSTRHYLGALNQHNSEKGEFLGAIFFYMDISRQKEIEQELIKTREIAVLANKHKSEFLASMSHEIRTPMNAIMGFGELLLNRVKDEKNLQYLHSIITGGKNLLSLINDILDLSKIEAGKLELEYDFASPRKIMEEIGQIFSLKIKKKNLGFSVKIDNNTPEMIYTDEARLRQIMINLVGNSVKFTSAGFIALNLEVFNRDDKAGKTGILIEIIDTGIGISKSQLEKIFDAFHQPSGQSSKTFGGTGLGLNITKKLVELMGGAIRVGSEPGRGTKFTIELPELEFSDDKTRISIEEGAASFNDVIFKNQKALIVDDIEYNRALIKEYLEGHNLRIFEAEGGKESIDLAKKEKPEIILMDIRMPDMDGFAATEILKSAPGISNIPVIALSASAMKSDRDKIDNRFDGYISKPVSKAALLAKLTEFLGISEKGALMDDKEKAGMDGGSPAPSAFSPGATAATQEEISDAITALKGVLAEMKNTAQDTLMLSEMKAFASAVAEKGNSLNISEMAAYGDKMMSHCENLEFDQIISMMDAYDDLIEVVSELQQGGA